MTASIKNFKDKAVSNPKRWNLQNMNMPTEFTTVAELIAWWNAGNASPDLEPDFGTIYETGTKNNATNLNSAQQNGLFFTTGSRIDQSTYENYSLDISNLDLFFDNPSGGPFEIQLIFSPNETNTYTNPNIIINSVEYRLKINGENAGIGSIVSGKTYMIKLNIASSICNVYFLGEFDPYAFDTVSNLQNSTWLKEGDVVEVLGYYEKGDGAGHKRIYSNINNGTGIISPAGGYFNYFKSIGNIKHFGAKDDGNDYSSEIEKCFNFCDTTYVPSGTYIANNITISNDNKYIFGKGELKNTSSSYTTININNAKNVVISLISITGTDTMADVGLIANSGIVINGSENIKILNCNFKEISSSGIYFSGCKNLIIHGNTMKDFYFYNATAGEILAYGNNQYVKIIENTLTSDCSQSIAANLLGSEKDIVISKNIITTIISNVEQPPTNKRHGIMISYNGTSDPETYGRILVSNNIIKYCNWTAVYCTAGATNYTGSMKVVDNVMKHIGYGVTTIAGGIFFNAGFDTIDIRGNTIEYFMNDQVGAIEVTNNYSGSNSKFSIKNNIIRETYYGIRVTQNAKNIKIESNEILDFQSTGISISYATETNETLGCCKIFNNTLETKYDSYGIFVDNNKISTIYPEISHNFIKTTVIGTTLFGILLRSNDNAEIFSNQIENYNRGFKITEYVPNLRNNPNEFIMKENKFINCVKGTDISSTSSASVLLVGINYFINCGENYGTSATNPVVEGIFINGKLWFSKNNIPTTGTWNVGDRCENSDPATGEYAGWVYTTTGWKGYGLIA